MLCKLSLGVGFFEIYFIFVLKSPDSPSPSMLDSAGEYEVSVGRSLHIRELLGQRQ